MLGQRLKQARIEAGLSQRQLCGEEITRNMLSQIESGKAKPSMQTLTYLAQKLGKSVSWFLGEEDILRDSTLRFWSSWNLAGSKTLCLIRRCGFSGR